MQEAPAPLTPPESDLIGLPYMLVDFRFFDSEMEAHLTDREFRSIMYLRSACWQARPAASLPNDDAILARHARLDLRQWRRLRAAGRVLSEFVMCADGRLYHTWLAQKACAAWGTRVRERARKRNERAEAVADRQPPDDHAGTGERPIHDHEATGAVHTSHDKPSNLNDPGNFVRAAKYKDKNKNKKEDSPPYPPPRARAGSAWGRPA